MLASGLLLSIGLPLLAGLPWLLAAQSQRAAGGWPLSIAYGYVLGLLITIAGMRVLHFAHLPTSLLTAAFLPAIAGAVGWWRIRTALVLARADIREADATWRAMNRATRVVFVAALGLIAVRLVTLGLEIILQPIFPWEAVSAVAAKARVWYALGMMAPFVPAAAWLDGLGNFTDAEPAAFALPSLLLVWTAHAIGQWHEGAVGMPWWMLGASMALALYGHLRRAGGGAVFSLCAAYLFLSLPLVDVHIALAGAPQWVAATGVGLAGCAALRWLEAPSRDLVYCFMIGTALAVLSLASTWWWFAIFAVAAAMRHWPGLTRRAAVGIPLMAILGLLALMQTPLKIAGVTMQLQVAGRWGETIESLFLLNNWHLLYGAALLVAVTGGRHLLSAFWLARTWTIAMGFGLVLVWGTLMLPGFWYGGQRDLSFAALQFAPILLLWIATAAHAIAHRHQSQVATTPQSSPPR